ncbi:MAG TPA: hypothetical protein VFR27_04475 [Mycobacterium sp.]|nr:hypothetical protein [Mycobacterium sp.]
MYRHRTPVLGAVLVAALGLSGCSPSEPPPPASLTSAAPVSVPPTQSTVLPTAEALTDVLYRLTDPAVPGTEKLDLIEGAQPADAGTLDRFVTALKDNGSLPLSFNAAEVAWSDREPGDAVANVDVTTASPDRPRFFFPMGFHPHGDGWQLSRDTTEMLLALGNSRTGGPPETPPPGG